MPVVSRCSACRVGALWGGAVCAVLLAGCDQAASGSGQGDFRADFIVTHDRTPEGRVVPSTTGTMPHEQVGSFGSKQIRFDTPAIVSIIDTARGTIHAGSVEIEGVPHTIVLLPNPHPDAEIRINTGVWDDEWVAERMTNGTEHRTEPSGEHAEPSSGG